jgi:hypothetical protein
MDSGRIAHEQVTYETLDPSILGSLNVETRDVDDLNEEQGLVDGPKKQSVPAAARIDGERETESDYTRQFGDSECYKIYFRAIGWKVMTVFMALLVLMIAFTKLPRKSKR